MSFAMTEPPPAVSPRVAFPAALVLCLAVAAFGSWVAAPEIGGWYAGLRKPVFTPPDRALLVAWPLLHVMTALAAGRIAVLPRGAPLRREAPSLLALQLAFAAVWPFIFFGRHNPQAGLLTVVFLLAVLAATSAAFRRLDRRAGLLMLPSLAAIAFACVLNGTIVAMN